MPAVSDYPFSAMNGGTVSKTAPVDTPKSQGDRLHFLDWLRLGMVTAVVYAHITLSGVAGGLPVASPKLIDDWDWNLTDPTPFGIRPLCMARSFGLPLLFWISGVSSAMAFKGKMKGFGRLASYGVAGIFLNAAIWYLGPQESACAPFSQHSVCETGSLLNFTIVPLTGNIFPLIFQMWYVLVLLLLTFMNWPLMAFLHGTGQAWYVVVQWAGFSGLYLLMIRLAGGSCRNPVSLAVILTFSEALYLLLACAAAPAVRDRISRKLGFHWQRAHQYAVAVLGLLQFAATPISERIDSISALFCLFIFINFNKFFTLGFLVTKARQIGPVQPLLSNVWPFVFFAALWCAPSTNWYLAGNLTYPYYERVEARLLYSTFGTVVIFGLERAGLTFNCMPMPTIFTIFGLVLYLIHPTVLTVFISFGLNDVFALWWVTLGVTLAGVASVSLILKCK